MLMWKEISLGILCFTLYVACIRIYRIMSSPLRHLAGPPKGGFLLGNLSAILDPRKTMRWFFDFGSTFRVDGPLGSDSLITQDLKAISHVINHGDVYIKPPAPSFMVKTLVGEGILTAEHGQPRRQRKILNPAFGVSQVRELAEIFNSESRKLCDHLDTIYANGPVNITQALGECTMQIIGLGGFDYDFRQQSKELLDIFTLSFQGSEDSGFMFTMLQGFFPILRHIRTEHVTNIQLVRRELDKVGRALMDRVRKELDTCGSTIERKDLSRKDILSLLVRANMATDIPDSLRLSDAEMIDQIPTFIFAGSETTSTAVSWTLFELCKHPEIQAKLRTELLTLDTDDPSMDELNCLPYLDNVIREALRIWPPIAQIIREAIMDDVIPCSKPVVDQIGITQKFIPIRKGQWVHLHVLGVNKSKEIWGDNAEDFQPERWNDPVPEGAHAIPGMWGNILSFHGGPHGCIGFRFAIVEAKCLLFALIRAYTFELAVPSEKISASNGLITKPVVTGNKERQSKLPLLIRPFRAGD